MTLTFTIFLNALAVFFFLLVASSTPPLYAMLEPPGWPLLDLGFTRICQFIPIIVATCRLVYLSSSGRRIESFWACVPIIVMMLSSTRATAPIFFAEERSCAHHAEKQAGEAKISICEVISSPESDAGPAIIYDGTDEIARPKDPHSSEWTDAIQMFKDNPDGLSIFTSPGTVLNLGRHFYLVR